MKKRKLLLLTAAVLCLLMAFTACGKEDSSGDSILDYFAPDEEPVTQLSKVTDIAGEVVARDDEHNLIAVDRKYDNSSRPDLRCIYVYNFSDGNIEKGYCYSTGTYTADGNTEYSIEFDYPLFRVTELNYGSGSDQDTYEYSYYRFTENNSVTSIATDVDEEDDTGFSVETVNNLYVCEANGEVYWINSDLKVLRQFDASITDGYRLPDFYAEYKGYLYTQEFDQISRRVQVFNKEGVCQVLYTHPNNTGLASVFVLNDGNVFIQEQLMVEDGEEYDLRVLNSTENGMEYVKMNVVSKILNFKTGEVTELDLDFMVDVLYSAYALEHENEYVLVSLAEASNNVAYITRFANGSLASVSSTVILDNLMNIEYTAPSMGANTVYTHIFKNGNYIVGETVAEEVRYYLYDQYGKKLATLPETFDEDSSVHGDYILAGSMLYSCSMKKLYDLQTSPVVLGYEGYISDVLMFGDRICFEFWDALTDYYVYYAFDESKKDLCSLAPGKTEYVWWMSSSEDMLCYFVYDWENENETLYALDGTALLRVQDAEWGDCTEMNGIVLFEAYVDGEYVCYIVG